MKPSRKALLILILVFILGAACGVGGCLFVLGRSMRNAFAYPSAQNAPIDRLLSRVESSLASELQLTDPQRSAIHSELQQTSSNFKSLRSEVRQKIEWNVRDTIERLNKHLPPDKQAKLRENAAKRLNPWGLLLENEK